MVFFLYTFYYLIICLIYYYTNQEMNKLLVVSFFILSFITLSHQACDNPQNGEPTAYDCISQESNPNDGHYCCFVDSPTNPKCLQLTFSNYEEFKTKVNEQFSHLSITSMEQVHCGSDFEQCINVAPDEGIDETCTNQTTPITPCCYMKVKYAHGKTYGCYPVEKDKDTIKEVIKALKKEYIGSKSIEIDCSSKYISLSVISFIVLLLL